MTSNTVGGCRSTGTRGGPGLVFETVLADALSPCSGGRRLLLTVSYCVLSAMRTPSSFTDLQFVEASLGYASLSAWAIATVMSKSGCGAGNKHLKKWLVVTTQSLRRPSPPPRRPSLPRLGQGRGTEGRLRCCEAGGACSRGQACAQALMCCGMGGGR
jgi:hypothetical protein